MAQYSEKQGNIPPTAKNARRRAKKPINELKTAAKALGKTTIDLKLLRKTIPYYFALTKGEKPAVQNYITLIQLKLLHEKVKNYCKFGQFEPLFVAWYKNQPTAQIAQENNLPIYLTHYILAYCTNVTCKESLKLAHRLKMRPLPPLETPAQIKRREKAALKQWRARLGIATPKKTAARWPISIKKDFAALGIEPPKASFRGWSQLTHAAKMMILFERGQRYLLTLPQTTEIQQLILKIQSKKTKYQKIGWFTNVTKDKTK